MTGPKHHGNAPAADPRQRIVSMLLAALFLAYVLLSGLAPSPAAAQENDLPLQLQALCHGSPGSAPQSQAPDDAPADAPCCVLCCGAAHEGACAPPLAANLAVKAPPLRITLAQPGPRPLAPPSHRAQPQPARGPPALI